MGNIVYSTLVHEKASPSPPIATTTLHSVAQILTELANSADELGTALSDDPDVLNQHLVQLQRIDVFCQTLCQLSALLAEQQGSRSQIRLDEAALGRLRSQIAAASPDIAA